MPVSHRAKPGPDCVRTSENQYEQDYEACQLERGRQEVSSCSSREMITALTAA
jgi:hypothetical protein